MNIESNQIQTENWTLGLRRALAEPFSTIGYALFWAIVLPVAALLFGVVTAFELVFAYLRAASLVPALPSRRTA